MLEDTASAVTTLRQIEWLNSPISERVLIAEKLGEEGAEVWARSEGYKPLLMHGDRGIPQGIDQVWLNSDGGVLAIEAKAQGSPVKMAYGYLQGTPEYAVKAAERMIISANTSTTAKKAALRVLEAARDGSLETCVIRTKHCLGEPFVPEVDRSYKSTSRAAEMASTILKDVKVITKVAALTGEAATVLEAKPPIRSPVGKVASEVAGLFQ